MVRGCAECTIKYFKKIPFFVNNPEAAGKALEALQEKTESKEINFTKMSASLLKDVVKGVYDVGKGSYDLHELNNEIDEATVQLAIQDAAADAVEELDAALVTAVAKIHTTAGVAFDGVYSAKVASNVDSAAGKKAPGVHVVGAIAAGYESAFTTAAPANLKDEFGKAGKAIGKSILSKGLGGSLD